MSLFIQGNQACALAAINGGVRFFAGYPITPSTEITEYMAKNLPKQSGVFIQMEDEIASIATALGASCCGVKSMTATSGPGFSLKQENIGYGIMAEIPLLIVNVQRMGPSTGAPTSPSQSDVMQARWGTHGDHPMVVYTASSVQETYEMTIHSLNVSEILKMPVVLLLDETIAHLREKMEVREYPIMNRDNKRIIGEGEPFHTTGLSHDEKGFPATNKSNVIGLLNKYLKTKVEKNIDTISKIDFKGDEDYDILFVSYGISYRSSLAAMNKLRKEGYKIGLINLLTLWPFPGEQLRYYAKKANTVMFAELNFEMIAQESRKYIEDSKIHTVNRVDGQLIEPDQIIESLRKKGDLPWKSY